MADKFRMYLLGLIILCPSLTGVSGAEMTRVFSSSGEDVSLPCNNVLSDCNSTTWNYNSHRTSSAVELFAGEIRNNKIKRHERLSLGSDCSLIIYEATVKDCGYYICQQFLNGHHYESDAHVFLLVLQVSVSPSSTQTEFRPGSSVTLTCQLFSYEPCDHLVRFERFQLVWVNQADVILQSDSRYQILSSGNCISTLTSRLLNEDNNTELRCLVKNIHEIKTSDSYTVNFKESATTKTQISQITEKTSIPIKPSPHTPNEQVLLFECHKTCVSLYRVIIVIVEVTVFAAPTVILLQIICAGRAENRRKTRHLKDTVISTVIE